MTERSGDWDQRELCPEGSCTGVIGPDGTCKVCGRVAPDWIDERARGLTPIPPESPGFDAGDSGIDEDEDDYEDGDEEDDDEGLDDDPVDDPAWDTRKLCSDGGCTGVIGDDGHCKVCGKAP